MTLQDDMKKEECVSVLSTIHDVGNYLKTALSSVGNLSLIPYHNVM